MPEIDLLDTLPKTKRDLDARASRVSDADREIAKRFDKEFFDGSRDHGYGGYRYDGRWRSVARRFRDHYGLTEKSSVLDVGCAKGFLLHDLKLEVPGVTVAGIDISAYAIHEAMPDVRESCVVGNAKSLPYPDKSFDLVISVNTLHNLGLEDLKRALREMKRVSRGQMFVVLDAYRDDSGRERMLKWNLTAETHMFVEEWERLFRDVDYRGDYHWFTP